MGAETGVAFYSNPFLDFFSKMLKCFYTLVSIVVDCIWPGKLDVDVEKAPLSDFKHKLTGSH